jgi:hypothetical protein
MLPVVFGVLLLLAAPAWAGQEGGLGTRNVNIDPMTQFPDGTAPGQARAGLGDWVGGRLSRSTITDHPATEANQTGWGGSSAPSPAIGDRK